MTHGENRRFGKLFSFLQRIIDLTGVISSDVDEIVAEQNAIQANYEQNQEIILSHLESSQDKASAKTRAQQIIQALRNGNYESVRNYLESERFTGDRRKLLKAIQKLLLAKADRIHLSIWENLTDARESLTRAGELLDRYDDTQSSELAEEFYKALESARESYEELETEEREVIERNMQVADNISDEFDTVTSTALQREKYENLEAEIEEVRHELEELQEQALEVLQDEAHDGVSRL